MLVAVMTLGQKLECCCPNLGRFPSFFPKTSMELGVGWKTSLDVAKGCWGDVLSSPSHRALPSPAAASLTLLAEGP